MATAEIVPQKPSIRITDFYRPWQKQVLWHTLPAKHRLAVGSFGSGKSRPLLMEAVIHCLEFPGCNCIILRKTMPDLKRTVIDKFQSDIPKALYERGSQERGTFNKSEHFVYWPPVLCEDVDQVTGAKIIDPATGKIKKVWRQSKLQFGACERVADVSKYLSTDYLFIGFEELGEFPFLIYDALEGRNRCTLWGTFPCMGGATNPMGIGWGWIKRLWIDHKPAHGMDPEKYNSDDYQFVHSTVDDNPILIRDKKYVESLEKSPLRAKIRWGDLETVSGTYFENFEESRHVLPRNAFIFESWQPVWVGWDYGFGHWAVITFWTKAWLKPRFEGEKKRMVNVTIKEIVMNGPGALPTPRDEEEGVDPKEATIMKRTAEEQAQALIMAIPRLHDEDNQETGYAWDISAIHFSWERFIAHTKNKEGDEVSVALQVGDILAAAGLPRPTRSSTDRVAGFTKMYSMLDMDEWFILDECKNCAEAIPLLVRGDGVTTNLEDVVKPKGASLPDDCGDSMRYAVAGALLDPSDKPKEQRRREEIEAIKDPMTKFVRAYKHWNEDNAALRNSQGGDKIQPSWMRRVKPAK
jgi:hypothetical protein